MQKTFVKYRTKIDDELSATDNYRSEYVVLPSIWLPDLLSWLSDIGAELCQTTDNVEFEYRLPITWPGYETCSYGIMVSDALHCVL